MRIPKSNMTSPERVPTVSEAARAPVVLNAISERGG